MGSIIGRREFIKWTASACLGGALFPDTVLASITTARVPQLEAPGQRLEEALQALIASDPATWNAPQLSGQGQIEADAVMQTSSRVSALGTESPLKARSAGTFAAGGQADLTTPVTVSDTGRSLDIRAYLRKMRRFNRPHENDIFLSAIEKPLLHDCVQRIDRIYRLIGHSNFYLLDFDAGVKIARQHVRVGAFTKAELDFIERLFYQDASHYGFLGEKPLKKLTDRVHRRTVVKLPGTGNYLFKGPAMRIYREIKKDIGKRVVLTSGVRGIFKQLKLFLDKTQKSQGNLSLASRSLAPPGYSFHGVSDFDVGQVGFGHDNFTHRFAETAVFKRLEKLNYFRLRYTADNLMGVRFEPWHIRVDRT